MRELKFRVWDVEAEEYLPISDGKCDGVIGISADGVWVLWLEDGEITRFENGRSVIVEQYTGLEDRGVEIYEGDIIKWTNSTGREITAPIVWNTRAWCWTAGDYMLGGLLEFDIEVVGNIHEDLKLLEDKN